MAAAAAPHTEFSNKIYLLNGFFNAREGVHVVVGSFAARSLANRSLLGYALMKHGTNRLAAAMPDTRSDASSVGRRESGLSLYLEA
jgi:hypothetical protein